MRSERFELTGDPAALAARLRALVPPPTTVHESVAEIIAGVRSAGDLALRDLTRRFDTGGTEPRRLVVEPAELEAARQSVPAAVLEALSQAALNVAAVAEASLREERVVSFDGHEVRLRTAPVARAAVYVPGGRAPYPSTVVMGAVTARVAGVDDVAVCAPPGSDGDVHPAILAACQIAGASIVYRMGGAQAIAALAYGTESVRPVDVIVGPGNLYVQEAKRQVFGQVGHRQLRRTERRAGDRRRRQRSGARGARSACPGRARTRHARGRRLELVCAARRAGRRARGRPQTPAPSPP